MIKTTISMRHNISKAQTFEPVRKHGSDRTALYAAAEKLTAK